MCKSLSKSILYHSTTATTSLHFSVPPRPRVHLTRRLPLTLQPPCSGLRRHGGRRGGATSCPPTRTPRGRGTPPAAGLLTNALSGVAFGTGLPPRRPSYFSERSSLETPRSSSGWCPHLFSPPATSCSAPSPPCCFSHRKTSC